VTAHRRKPRESQGRVARLRQALKVATDAFEALREDHFETFVCDTPKKWKLDPDDIGCVNMKALVAKLRAVYEEEKCG